MDAPPPNLHRPLPLLMENKNKKKQQKKKKKKMGSNTKTPFSAQETVLKARQATMAMATSRRYENPGKTHGKWRVLGEWVVTGQRNCV